MGGLVWIWRVRAVAWCGWCGPDRLWTGILCFWRWTDFAWLLRARLAGSRLSERGHVCIVGLCLVVSVLLGVVCWIDVVGLLSM